MMPNVVRGDRMAGLITYLAGPGRANEHTEPHIVAGDGALLAWYADEELSRDSALAVARHLDRPHTAYGVDVSGGHVWHCSLSLRADEGMLTDEQWQSIADDFVRAMEFDDNEGTKAPCRWVAIRHGVSKNGNDHVHLAVNLVREDGTKVSVHNDFKRAQAAARALEVRFGLEELESVQAERSTRGYKPGEREAMARRHARGKYEGERRSNASLPAWNALPAEERNARIAHELRATQPRYDVALRVRAAATSAKDEAEFVRRLRRSGLLVRPRYAQGRNDVVVGYSVAERSVPGERPIWYGGQSLARDLTLPRLRRAWEDTPEGATAAVAEWNAARRGRRVANPGREMDTPTETSWTKTQASLEALVSRLHDVPVDDRQTWQRVARETSGALASWSLATEPTPGPLANASHALSRSAQTFRPGPVPERPERSALTSAAMLLGASRARGHHLAADLAMMREMLRLTQAVHDSARATGQARHAQMLANETRAELVAVRDTLRASEATEREALNGQTKTASTLDPEAQAMLDRLNASRGASASSPVPSPLTPKPRTVAAERSEPTPER